MVNGLKKQSAIYPLSIVSIVEFPLFGLKVWVREGWELETNGKYFALHNTKYNLY